VWQEFSDRAGITDPIPVQLDSMSEELRNGLWNVLLAGFRHLGESSHWKTVRYIWGEFFRLPLDEIPSDYGTRMDALKQRFFEMPWYDVYNLLQFMARNEEEMWGRRSFDLRSAVNEVLRKERSGYRFIGDELVPISDPEEIQSIRDSVGLATETGLTGARRHLEAAIELLAKRPEPDYRNCIKESVSAVESLVRHITGKDTFSRAIAELDSEIGFHGSFRSALNKLYGYSSDEDGIRHAILEEKDVGFDEAKFMLVICSALVNFIISKASKHGLLQTQE
jgi:hypothetical protein